MAVKDKPEGTYTLTLKKRGYRHWQQLIEITPESPGTIHAELVSAMGRIRINSKRSGS